MRARIYPNFDALPPAYTQLFAEAAKESFYHSLPWFRNLVETTAEPGEELRLYGLESDSRQDAALALLVARCGARPLKWTAAARGLSGYSTTYTTLYGPVWRPLAAKPADMAARLAEAIRAESPRWKTVHFDSLDPNEPFFSSFVDAMRAAGMLIHTYFSFGNWFEDVSADSIQDFLARRPSAVRNTLERKGRKLERAGRSRYQLFTSERGLDAAIADYEAVYAASWKQWEPFPRFVPGLIRAAASAGCLRLGILYLDDEPVAAQIWIVAGGGATIYKLAHDERHKGLSLGSILTLRLMQHVIEVDRVREVDFGRGDDPYKSQWLSQRRERWGIVAFNPRTLHGALGALRHIGGHKAKAALYRLAGKQAG